MSNQANETISLAIEQEHRQQLDNRYVEHSQHQGRASGSTFLAGNDEDATYRDTQGTSRPTLIQPETSNLDPKLRQEIEGVANAINEDKFENAQNLWQQFFQRHRVHTPSDKADDSRKTLANRFLTVENQKNNIPWGDFLQEKEENAIRVFSNNVNGFQIDKLGGTYDHFCEVLNEINADVTCIQEHNLDISQYNVSQCIRSASDRQFSRHRTTFSHSPTGQFISSYKPGGVAIVSRESIVGRIVEAGSDDWGRWSYQVFSGTKFKKLWVFSLYQVVQVTNPQATGKSTVHSQQVALLRHHRNDDVTTPRQAFKLDLEATLKPILADPLHQVLLCGDFNEAYRDGESSLKSVCSRLGLTDLMRSRHPLLRDPATYARGSTRLDFALGTDLVAQSILKCGYEPFYHRYATDHRAFFFDLDSDILFGAPTQQLVKSSMRGLHSNNKIQVAEYILHKHRILTSVNAFERAKKLNSPGNRHSIAEKLDRDILRASLCAEKKVTKFGTPMWSMALADARKEVLILKLTLSSFKNGIDTSNQVKKLREAQNERTELPLSMEECRTRLTLSQQKVAMIIKNHYNHRESERELQIQRLEACGDIPSNKLAKILKQIRKAEAIKKMFKKLRGTLMSQEKQGITQLEVPVNPEENPKTCHHWKTLEVPNEIMAALQERNRRHFSQAYGTPFTMEPLASHLNFDGVTGEHVTDCLDGSYDLSVIPDFTTRQFISRLYQDSETRQRSELASNATMTLQELKEKLKSWTETTSTSPSRMHLGHWKSLIAPHQYSFANTKATEKLKEELDKKQLELLRLHLTMLNYAMRRGYSYTRWQTIVNTMILKEPGNFKIHRTRVIHLYEADYNLVLGIKWRQALFAAEHHLLLNPGQFGSRPYRNAHDPVFIELLQTEISLLSRKSLIQTNYDASSCYDRIIPNLAAVVSQKFGVSSTVALVNTKTLQEATYKLKTELGVSESGYQHSAAYPIFGTGQGSSNSPIIWCFVSSILFDCYQDISHGAFYESPDRKLKLKLHMVGFVDDTNGQTNDFLTSPQPTIPELLQKMQEDAQNWNDLLWVSGGVLEVSKCSYQFLHWEFKSDGSPIIVTHPINHEVRVKTQDSITSSEIIPFMPVTQEHKTLGTFQSFSGNQEKQLSAIADKCAYYNEALTKSSLSSEEVWTFYFAIFLPSIGYPLPTTHLSQSQLEKCQSTVMRTFFSRCGYNRNTKREILFGPSRMGGAGFRHFHVIQGTGQIMYFVKHWRLRNGLPGKLLRIAVSWMQNSLGVSYSFLDDVSSPLPHMEGRWFQSLRDYCASISATITLDEAQIPHLERVNDSYIMESILESKQFTDKEIRILNYCRMYLGVITVSDIAVATGRQLNLSLLQGNKTDHVPKSRWLLAEQMKPGKAAWKLWQRANRIWSTSGGMLYLPLQGWLIGTQARRHEWPYYLGDKILYVREHFDRKVSDYEAIHEVGKGFPRFFMRSQRRRHLPQKLSYIELPDDAIPVEASSTSIWTWKVDDPRYENFRPKQQDSNRSENTPDSSGISDNGTSTLTEKDNPFNYSVTTGETHLLQGVHLEKPPIEIFRSLQQPFLVASDGSVTADGRSSFGWVLALPSGERLAQCSGAVSGSRKSSYRAEGVGILSVLHFLSKITEYGGSAVDSLVFELGCDNEAMILFTRACFISGQTQFGRPHGLQRSEQESVPQPASQCVKNQLRNPRDLHKELGRLHDPLKPEWDVLVEIFSLASRFRRADAYHVKGHQDRKKAFSKLTMMERLNVDADKLATAYHAEHHENHRRSELFVSTGAHLHLLTGTITSKWASQLRNTAAAQPLERYIQERNQWSPSIFEDINWTAHGTVLARRFKRQSHFVKLVHDILPTNARLHRLDDRQSPWCPMCARHVPETRDHLLQCTAPEVETWRRKFLESIGKFHEQRHTDPGLQAIMTEVLKSMTESGVQDLGSDTLTSMPEYDELIRRQQSIGWRQIFNGRFSKHWESIQAAHDARVQTSCPGKKLGVRGSWTVQMIDRIWDGWWELWLLRNQTVHGHDAKRQAEIKHQKLIAEIKEIYERKSEYEPNIQDLLFEEMDSHLQQPYRSLHNWLAVYRPIFSHSIQEAKRKAIQGVRSIRMYFQHLHAPPWRSNTRMASTTTSATGNG